jgi:predicted Zn-dependent protease
MLGNENKNKHKMKINTKIKLLLTLSFLLFSQISTTREIILPDIGASSSIVLSQDMENKIGRSVINQLQNSFGLINDLEINTYLNNLGYSLVEQTGDSLNSFTFFLLNSPQINAFATPGGIVAVYSGLFLTTETESELASVVGHEIAHVTQNHLARAFEKASQMNIPLSLGLIAAIILGAAGAPEAGIAAATGVQAMGTQSQIDVTRANEKEADRVGIKYLYKANYNPYGMPEFFQKLHQKNRYVGGSDYPEFLRTHPVTTNRIAESHERAVQYHKKITFIKDESNYLFMKGKLLVIASRNTHQIEDHYQKLSNNNSRKHPVYKYIYAQSLLKNHKPTQAIEVFKQLYERDKNNTYIITGYAKSLLASKESNNNKEGLKLLDKALKEHPLDMVLSAYYAEALIQMGKITQSIKFIKKYNQYSLGQAIFYKLLSRAYGKQGDLLKAHIAQADYYYLRGQYKQAITQISLAKKQAKKSNSEDFYSLSRLDSKLLEIKAEQERYKFEE